MRDANSTLTDRDWTLLFQAFSDALEWVLDRARDLASAYPDEVAAVERVRLFIRKRIAGDPAHVRVDDLLFTFGLVAGAIERQRATASNVVAMTALAKPAMRPHAGLLRRVPASTSTPKRMRRL